MKRALFIINPNSGIDRVKSLKKVIEANLNPESFQYEIVYTEYAKHGTLLAREGVKNGFDLIVAVGGDGSVNDVIQGIYGTKAVLGIIPKGSGNGLARSLNIPLNESKAIRLMNDWAVKNIDIGSADGHLFASNAGVGFDTIVTVAFSESRRRGLSAYLSIILKSVWRYKVKEWNLTIDGKPVSVKAFMLTVANARQLGYGFKIAPTACLNDRYFDLVIVRKFPVLMAASVALRAFTGKIKGSPYVTIQKAKEIVISHPELQALQIDGEALHCEKRIIIKMLPEQLKVLSGKEEGRI